jgi:hypothetical protein
MGSVAGKGDGDNFRGIPLFYPASPPLYSIGRAHNGWMSPPAEKVVWFGYCDQPESNLSFTIMKITCHMLCWAGLGWALICAGLGWAAV